ncbi:MAG: tetratricopeptide repeat protein, partial [Myxococcota bacterium]
MSEQTRAFVDHVKRLIDGGQCQEAVRTCRRRLLGDPAEVTTRIVLGQALVALGRYDEARSEMLALTRDQVRIAEVYHLIGDIYLRTSSLERAREMLQKALELSSGHPRSVALLAEL